MNEFVENNRSLRNGRTRLHQPSRFYDLEGFEPHKTRLTGWPVAPPHMFSSHAVK